MNFDYHAEDGTADHIIQIIPECNTYDGEDAGISKITDDTIFRNNIYYQNDGTETPVEDNHDSFWLDGGCFYIQAFVGDKNCLLRICADECCGNCGECDDDCSDGYCDIVDVRPNGRRQIFTEWQEGTGDTINPTFKPDAIGSSWEDPMIGDDGRMEAGAPGLKGGVNVCVTYPTWCTEEPDLAYDIIGVERPTGTTETWDIGAFQQTPPPTNPNCTIDADCDDSVFCNGAETCVSEECVAGSDPCEGDTCDEENDTCESAAASFEGYLTRYITASWSDAIESRGTAKVTWLSVTYNYQDAEERVSDGNTVLTSSDLEIPYDSSYQIVGVQFQNVPLRVTDTVTSMKVQFYDLNSPSGDVDVNVTGESSASSAMFSTTAYDISGRADTTASVNWLPGEWTNGVADANSATPNIKSIALEILALPAWQYGQTMTFFVANNATVAGEKRISRAIDTYGLKPVTLKIEYIIYDGAGTTDVVDMTTSDIVLGTDGGSDKYAGLAFVNVSATKNITFTNSGIQFKASEQGTGTDISLQICGVLTDTAVFTTTDADISDRKPTFTDHCIDWIPSIWGSANDEGASQLTPDLSPIMNEIIQHTSWVSPNTMVFVISPTQFNTYADRRVAYSYDSGNTSPFITGTYIQRTGGAPPTTTTTSTPQSTPDPFEDNVIIEALNRDDEEAMAETSTGVWANSTVDGKYGSNKGLWSSSNNSGPMFWAKNGTYTFTTVLTGMYSAYEWHTDAPSRDPEALHILRINGVEVKRTFVDQTDNDTDQQWNQLFDEPRFYRGDTVEIVVSAVDAAINRTTFANAILFSIDKLPTPAFSIGSYP